MCPAGFSAAVPGAANAQRLSFSGRGMQGGEHNPTIDTSVSAYVCPVQNNELVEMLQERVRELEAEAEASRQQLEDTEQQLKDTQDANQ